MLLTYVSEQKAKENREVIRDLFMEDYKISNSKLITIPQMQKIFSLYDELIFENQFKKMGYEIIFSWGQMTKSAGKISLNKISKKVFIKFSPKIFSLTFHKGDKNEYHVVNGIKCYSRIEAFQSVMEHELTHLIEFIETGKTGHGKSFQFYALKLFGHTKTYHELPVHKDHLASKEEREQGKKEVQIAANRVIPIRKIIKESFRDKKVSFMHKGRTITGTVVRINANRATVIPDNGIGKWFVPYFNLNII